MDLVKLKADCLSAFQNYSRAIVRGTRFVKVTLIIGGATAATVALAIDIAHANKEISAWTIVGFAGAFLVAVGSIYDAFREHDAAEALVLATRAVDAASQRDQEWHELMQEHGRFDKAVTRGLDLYLSVIVMRGAIEQSLDLPDISVENIIQTCLSAVSNSLLGAFDFGIKDLWTVCIFMAQPSGESGKVVLKCVAHLRKIACDLTNAREWPEGVGVAGIAYSMNKEIVIEDMWSSATVSMFYLPNSRDYDKERYISMAAIPITIGNNPKPIRAIAAMTALAVKAASVRPRALAIAPNLDPSDSDRASGAQVS